MQFHERSFDERFTVMGDESETVYEKTAPMGSTIRFGWRRPSGISFQKIPNVFRHAPDYYATSGYFVEVMGMGRDGILKSLKVEKYEALKIWKRISKMLDLIDLMLFVWNSHEKEFVVIEWKEVVKLVAKSKRVLGVQAFDDGNEYFPLEWDWLLDSATWKGSIDE